MGGELVADLGVELVDEAGCGHGVSSAVDGGVRRRSAASSRLTFLPSTLTSLRFLTVYPSGSVPSFSIRSGQRLQRSLDTQHFFFGSLATGRLGLALLRFFFGHGGTLARVVRVALPNRRQPSASPSSSTTAPVRRRRCRAPRLERPAPRASATIGAAVADDEHGLAAVPRRARSSSTRRDARRDLDRASRCRVAVASTSPAHPRVHRPASKHARAGTAPPSGSPSASSTESLAHRHARRRATAGGRARPSARLATACCCRRAAIRSLAQPLPAARAPGARPRRREASRRGP